MKKILIAVLSIIMCLSAVCGFAAEATPEYDLSAQFMVEWHNYFLENAYGDGDGYPLIRLSDDEYPGCVSYSTDSRLIDIIYENGDGEGLQLINVIIFRSDVEGDEHAFTLFMKHFVGTMYLYLPDMAAAANADTFTDELVDQMLLAWEQPYGSVWYGEPVDFGGVAEVVAYVEESDTFGVYIWFYEPISHDFLIERAEMMSE